MKRKTAFLFAAGGAVLAAAALASGRPKIVSETFAGELELIAASFTSAWCSSCKIIEPRLAKVIPDFAGKPVKFVEFDFSFGQQEQLRAKAAADGVEEAYDIYSKATGYTILIDAETGETIDVLTVNHSAGAMRAAVVAALAVAQSRSGDPGTDEARRVIN